MDLPPNPHDERLRLCWKICRFGAGRIADPAARAKVLGWIDRMRPAAAVRRFQLDNGAFPRRLEDAVNPPPIDPFAAAPIRYAINRGGRSARLWSRGWDLDDDGGGTGDVLLEIIPAE